VPCQTHVLPGKFIYLPWCRTAGIVLKWFRDNFCEEHVKQAAIDGIDAYDRLTKEIDGVPPGSDGVIVLPHLSGAMSPEMDADACGVIFGLALSTTRNHVVRAILESIAYMSRANIELVEEAGIEVREVILSGGASKSTIWNRIKTDVLGKRAKTIKNTESCCLGAAILAGLGAGVYKSAEEACRMIIADDVGYVPDMTTHATYENYYGAYKRLYRALKPVFQDTVG
jgi:xylulokinase